jgi:outer membrane receptor for ferrienterochelin and colicins
MRVLYIALMAMAATTAMAEELTDARLDSLIAAYDKEIDQVVVTGTRTPKLLSNSPILTRVITEADIRKTDATNIADLLQAELPGVEFSFSMNQQVSLNMQGFGGSSVLFLVDGERLSGETLDNVDYNRLNLCNVARIEIVKGAASSLYGSNAVGGVINIITKDMEEPFTLQLNGRYGSHNERRGGAVLGLKSGNLASSTTVQHTGIDSYDFKNEGDYSRYYGGHSWDFKERLTYDVNDKLRLVGRAGYFFRQRNAAELQRDRYRDFSGGLRGVYTPSAVSNLEVSYAYDQYDKSDYMVTSSLDIRKYSNVQNSGRAVYNHTFGTAGTMTVGGDVLHDYLQSYQFENNGNKTQTTLDAFAQWDVTLWKKLNVIAGVRYDYFSEAEQQHVSSKLNLMYRWNRLTFRGSYAGGFRAPTLKEMYMNYDMASIFMIYGNKNLKPEESHNFRLSAEYTKGLFNASATGFYNVVDNRITTAWNQTLNGQMYSNIARMYVSGIDAFVSAKTRWGLGGRLSYCYTHERVPKGEAYTSSTRPHTATVRVDYTKQWKGYGLDAVLSGRFLSKVSVDEYTSVTSYEETERVNYPGYSIWKLNLTHHFSRGINVTMAVDNLLNYVPSYYYSNSPSTNGTTFMVGLTLDVDKMFKK